MPEQVGQYNDGGLDSCAIHWPEGGPIEGECYTHAAGDPECRFQIEQGLKKQPLFNQSQRDAMAWRFTRIDAEARNPDVRVKGEGKTLSYTNRNWPLNLRFFEGKPKLWVKPE